MKKIIWILCTAGCFLLLFAAGALADAADPMDIVRTVLSDPQELFAEDAGMMEENDGQYFGDVAEKHRGEDRRYYEFISGSSGADMIGKLNFLDVGNFRGNAQAVLLKFRSDAPDGLSFTLSGAGNVTLFFADGRPMFAHRQDDYQAPYAQYRETDLTVESNHDYWVLMAFDPHGYYRSLVWADDDPENAAYCGENIGDWHSAYQGSNWRLDIALGPNQTLQLERYSIMDFSGIAGMEGIGNGQDQGGMDTADPMAVVSRMVANPQVLYADDISSLPERGYSAYSDVADKHPGDGFEFITAESVDGFTFLTPLYDAVPPGSRRQNKNQGVLLCFKTNHPEELELKLTAENTVFMTFASGRMPAFGIQEMPGVGLKSFDGYDPPGFVLENDVWYYAMLVVDEQSGICFRVWERDFDLNYANYQTKITDWCQTDEERARFTGQNWTFGVTMGHNAQFHLMDFRVLDFDGFQTTAE